MEGADTGAEAEQEPADELAAAEMVVSVHTMPRTNGTLRSWNVQWSEPHRIAGDETRW